MLKYTLSGKACQPQACIMGCPKGHQYKFTYIMEEKVRVDFSR